MRQILALLIAVALPTVAIAESDSSGIIAVTFVPPKTVISLTVKPCPSDRRFQLSYRYVDGSPTRGCWWYMSEGRTNQDKIMVFWDDETEPRSFLIGEFKR